MFGIVNASSLIEELSKVNQFPGITYCSELSGLDCGLPSSGCLLYRVYNEAIDNRMYELQFEIDRSQGRSRSFRLSIHLNTQKSVFDNTVSVTSTSIPPIPFLHSHYI
uniref:Phlebovirus_G2 domain-containing protein n=1 Tax=Haemonchus placei TaxID=6290 RepID=A0A0N4W2E4_HAEPC